MADCWTKNDSIFVCDGYKYGIAKGGATAYLGSVEEKEKEVSKVAVGVVPKAPDKPPVGKKVVAKIPGKGIVSVGIMLQEKRGIMQHRRGRPPKSPEEVVHRATEWRRRKQEAQGVLL